MHRELVDRRKWISNSRFLHALNYCMLLPGPEAQQLAIYIGWLLHKTWGGIVAGTLFVLPSMFLLWLLSLVYVVFGKVEWIESIFYGLKPAVVAIVASAVIRIGKTTLKSGVLWAIAGAAFIAIYVFKAPFPAIVVGAGFIGLACGTFWKSKFLGAPQITPADSAATSGESNSSSHTTPSFARAVRVVLVSLALWWFPVVVLALWLGSNHTVVREGVFFSKAALVTFGGAYAVLPYVAQRAVEQHGWLTAGQMLDGLALAETTPGPLIMVLQFVGFLGGWQNPGALSALWSATLGAFITTWTTFVPCFLWILVGAPHIEQLHGHRILSAALTAVTAAIVGVILNLAVWFGIHVLMPSDNTGAIVVDWFAAAVTLIAFFGIVKWKWDIIPVILGAGCLGLVRQFLG